jgi:hypothetical protein
MFTTAGPYCSTSTLKSGSDRAGSGCCGTAGWADAAGAAALVDVTGENFPPANPSMRNAAVPAAPTAITKLRFKAISASSAFDPSLSAHETASSRCHTAETTCYSEAKVVAR